MRAGLTVAAASAALLLSGCDGGGEPRNVTRTKVGDSGYLERLRGLDPLQRNLTLRRAIQDSRQRCRRIEGSAETGTYENMAVWTVRCDETTDWAVFIAPSGDAQVRSCVHVEQLGLPACNTEALQGTAP